MRIPLEIKRESFLLLWGATGSSKSTLIQHFNGLMALTSGKLRVCGVDVSGEWARRDLWRRVGLVFQHPEQQLFEETVFDDVAFGPKNMGLSGNEVRQRVIEALRLVGLDPEQAERQSPSS